MKAPLHRPKRLGGISLSPRVLRENIAGDRFVRPFEPQARPAEQPPVLARPNQIGPGWPALPLGLTERQERPPHSKRAPSHDDYGRAPLGLNAWVAITLLALGLHNLPLAVPGVLNIGYHVHSGRAGGWAIVGIAVVVHVGLFIGSVIFLASGQRFEQFRGVQ